MASGAFAAVEREPLATTTQHGLMSATDKAKLDLLTVVADSGWVDVGSYGTNWATYDGTTYLAQYRKLPDGMVLLRGMVKKAAALGVPETMFTLPAGYRPGKATPLPVASAAGYATVQVYGNGQVNLDSGGSATWVSLAAIAFKAEN